MTMSPPWCALRKSRSQTIESASRWLVGSSSSSVSAPREQDAGQLDAPALAAGEGAQRLAEDAVGQAEAGRDRGRLGLGGVAAAGVELRLEPAVPAHRLVAGRRRPRWPSRSRPRAAGVMTASRPRADRIRSRASTSRSPVRGSCGR